MQQKTPERLNRIKPPNIILQVDKHNTGRNIWNNHVETSKRHNVNGSNFWWKGSDVQSSNFWTGMEAKDSQNFIWITSEMLDKFRTKDLHSTTGGLSSTSVKYYRHDHNRGHLPPMFAERLRVLEERATKKKKKRDKTSYRMNLKPEFHINIRGCTGLDLSNSALKDDSSVSNHTGIHGRRSMDSVGEERREPHPDDVIESVAKANSVHMDNGSVLPEIRAAPCPIHMKRERGKGQDLLYSSNSHAKTPRRLNPHMISLPQPDPSSHGLNQSPRKTNKFDLSIRIPEQFPIKPPLPKQLSSKDFVMSWLIHGSAPEGSNHFPDIVQQRNTDTKTRSKLTPRRSELSE